MLIGVDSLQGGYNSAVFALRLRAVSKRFIKWSLSQEPPTHNATAHHGNQSSFG